MGEQSRPQFMRRAWAFDLEKFYIQVGRIRAALPEEVKNANRVLEDRDRVIEGAKAERERLLEDAREQAALLVSHDEIVRRASEQADEMLRRATAEAGEMRRSAEEYATRALANLEEYVMRVLTAVRTARGQLSAGSDTPTRD
jgi:vacuolar-type H+-ATPase subunit H